jgi:hypothetical protein
MQKIIAATALAVTLSLSLAPATALAPAAAEGAALADAPVQAQMAAATPVAAPAFDPVARDARLAEAHQHVDHASEDIAPGQGRAAFEAWLARDTENRAAVAEFSAHLTSAGVGDVLPAWQLVRTSSSWRECGADGFEVAPRDKWDNIVRTLRFVKEEVVPVVGPVRALSGYRNASLNACSNGAPASAHRHFHALDLMPVSADVSRAELIQDVCRAHARAGRDHDTGLGFYSGMRFHVDSSGFRRWGANGSGATSPCVTYS